MGPFPHIALAPSSSEAAGPVLGRLLGLPPTRPPACPACRHGPPGALGWRDRVSVLSQPLGFPFSQLLYLKVDFELFI